MTGTLEAMPASPQIEIKQTEQTDDVGPGSRFGHAVRVVVLNDDHNTFEGVALALARVVPGVDAARGMQLAVTIHANGSACVWSGDREVAELYWEQLRDLGLTLAPLAD
jgi:ATP-dependent Clp protease adaptor protein ClpS